MSGDQASGELFKFSLDEPREAYLSTYRIVVRGWLLPAAGHRVISLRLKNNASVQELEYGLDRPDVAKAFKNYNDAQAPHCGFETELYFEGGNLVIEADFGSGYVVVHQSEHNFASDNQVAAAYNPHLASRWADHQDILAARSAYFYESNRTAHTWAEGDPKLITFYLPQFHPIPENDEAWGKGFTEWTNVAAATPRFVGHQQPLLPGDLGFYDLRVDETIAEQMELAKSKGLYGFCFYYYWFSGKSLLERPLNSFLSHPEWDFNFMICWANENWTKRWDGKDSDVIVAQKYLKEDPLNFIKAVEPILADSRYIHIDGKPALLVYRPEQIKNIERYVATWRDYFRQQHNTELHLISVMSFANNDPTTYGFDAAIDFMPQGTDFKSSVFLHDSVPPYNVNDKLLDLSFSGVTYDFREIVRNQAFLDQSYPFTFYRCVMPSWDNDARKKGKGAVFYNSSPDLYRTWLKSAIRNRANSDEPVFVNAWNEWAEGTVLEPTASLGYAALNRTAEVVGGQAAFGVDRSKDTLLAVIIHLYYSDQWEAIAKRLANLGTIKADVFITIRAKDASFIKSIRRLYPQAYIYTVPNRGRDILPFVHLARRLTECGYESFLKLHTKKSRHRTDGEAWFNELLSSLLPSKSKVVSIYDLVSHENAIIAPKGHYVSLEKYLGSNEGMMRALYARIYGHDPKDQFSLEEQSYPGGSMFWASASALQPLLDLYLTASDFEPELGQIDGTTAHAVERLVGVVAKQQGANLYQTGLLGIHPVKPKHIRTEYKYAS